MKKCLIISLIMMLLVLCAWVTPVKAATGSVGISSTSVIVGSDVRITIYFGEKVKAAQGTLNYDTSKFTFNSISGGAQFNTTDNTIVYLNAAFKADLSSVTLSFTSKATGTANFSVTGLSIASATQTNFAPAMANTSVSTTVKAKETPKPDNGNSGNTSKPNTGNNSGTNTKPNTGSNSNNNTSKNPTVTKASGTVYATDTVSIRDSWSTSGKLLGTLQKDKGITRTGIVSNGWVRVNYNGKTGYISGDYVTTTKPKDDKKDDDKKDDDKNNTTNKENNTVNNETTNNEANNTTNNENNEVNNITNELANNEHQGSNEVKNEKKDSKNYIEYIIIGVIILAILVIIISEILAKKKNKKVESNRR